MPARILAGVLAAAGLARLGWVLFSDLRGVAFRTTDDAYYYFQVARNATRGLGFTFDGLHPTSGFHPLWMSMILPVFAATGRDPELALRAVHVLITLVATLTVFVAWRAVRALAGERAAFAAALAAAQPYALYPLVNGLETGVLVLLTFVLVWACGRHELLAPTGRERRDYALGALLGLACLARLDSVFLVPAFAGVAAVRALRESPSGWRTAFDKLLRMFAACAAVVAPYLAWNVLFFGHLVPISGALKSSFPHVSFTASRLHSFNSQYGLALITVTTVLLAGLLLHARRRGPHAVPRPALEIAVALWIGNALHLAYSLAFVTWGAQWWHYVSYLPATLLTAALAFDVLDRRTGRRRATLVVAAAAAAALFAVGIMGDRMRRGDTRAHWHEAMVWQREHLPPDAVLAMTDCGYVGYFGGRRVVNMDGVINGYEYQAALANGDLSGFLAESGVTHVASHRARYVDGRCVIDLPARLARRPGGAIVCTPAAEVYRSEEFLDEPLHPERGRVRFVIWDLAKVTVVNDARTLPAVAAAAAPH